MDDVSSTYLYSLKDRTLEKLYGSGVDLLHWIDNENLLLFLSGTLSRINTKNRQLTEIVDCSSYDFSDFSPDSGIIGFAEYSPSRVWIMDKNGENKKLVSDIHARELLGVRWDQNGKRLYFNLHGKTQYYDLGRDELRDVSNVEYNTIPNPKISPDKRMEIYFALMEKGHVKSIDIRYLDTGKEEVLVPERKEVEIRSLVWHPGSEWIAYTYKESGKPAYIHAVNVRTKEDIPLTEGAHPSWHSSGRNIAFWRVTPLSTDIFLYDWYLEEKKK